MLQEFEVNRDEVDSESLDENPVMTSNSCEVDTTDDIAVKNVYIKPSRYVYLRTIAVFLVSLSSLTAGILARLIL